MSDQPTAEPNHQLIARLEALLFVASGSVTGAQLATALETDSNLVEQTLAYLQNQYITNPCSGLRLQEHHGRYQLTSDPMLSLDIERFLGLEATGHLSRAALETLAIIAYQQPVTRPGIDAIRGVNSDGVLKSLLSKGLIQEVGRAEKPGRPILYSSTAEFLQHFGLSTLKDLPPLSTDENPQPVTSTNDSE